ncbi:MAG: hypothetical protein ACRCTY_02150 [Candidatus Adiutrix sp.]
MKKVKKFLGDKYLVVAVPISLALFDAKKVLAQGGLGDIGENIAGNMSGVAKGIQYAAFAGGVMSTVMGINDFRNVSSQKATVGQAVTKIAVGTAFLGLGAFISMSSSTIFGGDESSGMGELGL